MPPLTGTVPSVLPPSAKVTVPVGGVVPDTGATVAVNVTDWPALDGFCEDVSMVVVALWTPFPLSGIEIGRQLPPPVGHSKTRSVSTAGPGLVGVKLSLTVQVPGPVKPPPAPQVSKSKWKGALRPPLATSVR